MGIPRADACMDAGMLQGIRPVTPDHRCLEARFHADEESEEALQEQLLECDDEQEKREAAELRTFFNRWAPTPHPKTLSLQPFGGGVARNFPKILPPTHKMRQKNTGHLNFFRTPPSPESKAKHKCVSTPSQTSSEYINLRNILFSTFFLHIING